MKILALVSLTFLGLSAARLRISVTTYQDLSFTPVAQKAN
jgi:hypothetical protein